MALQKSRRRGTILAASRLTRGARAKKPTVAANGASGADGRKAAAEPSKPPAPKKYTTNLFCWPRVLPNEFVGKVGELEQELGQEVWLLVQGHEALDARIAGRIDFSVLNMFTSLKEKLPAASRLVDGKRKPPLALLIHSGGGNGEAAFRIASLLKRRCHGFTAVVPQFAKSAATLLALGADTILLGDEAELGPLDAQVFDPDIAEDWVSALDEVQAVEALEESALSIGMRVMEYLHKRTGKSYNVLMPNALHFAAEITKPLFDKIDAIRYSRQSRRLQEAQDYAEKLLRPRFKPEEAKAIAKDLVRNYPTHDFVIDRAESALVGKMEDRQPVGLQVERPTEKVNKLLDWFYANANSVRAIGRIEEFKHEVK